MVLCSYLFVPPVGRAHGDHDGENVVPGLLVHHHGIGEHAAVPADVPEGAGRLPVFAADPEAGVADDIKLAVGIVRQAVVAGFVVRAGAFHGGVVLGHLEVDDPGAPGGGQSAQRGV